MCSLSKELPLKTRFPLALAMGFWSVSWLCILMVIVNFIYPTTTPLWLAIPAGISFTFYVFLYVIGFWRTFERRKDTRHRAAYFFGQVLLIPLFSMMEAAGAIYGLVSPPKEFDIVQKQVN